jgi:ABC-2 type transport system ATP-binding protein
MNELMIETKGLTKKFGSFIAVNNINLKVKKGTIHGFVGPNGAGKTTTMKMLVGGLNPTAGVGFISGKKIGSLDAKKLIGYSPEHPNFYDDMAAFDYLVYVGKISGMSKKDVESKSLELLKLFELENFAHKKIGEFSAGMKQRLSLSQAMIHEPELLILDEPTANLDPEGRLSIIKKLRDLCKKKGITVFISSHILSELEKMIDDVTILNKGEIVIESDIQTLEKKFSGKAYLLKTSKNKEVLEKLKPIIHHGWIDDKGIIHIHTKGDEEVFKKKVLKVIVGCDATMESFTTEASDLESVFMKLVGKEEKRE